jgi:hypothetical protein
MSDPTDFYFTMPIAEFCRRAGIGQTLCRQMIADGRLRAVRAGKKKLLIEVASWREYIQRETERGTTEYPKTEKARATRRANYEARREDKINANLKDLELL